MNPSDDSLLASLQTEARRRQRTTDLAQFRDRIKEMMRLDISLPVVLEWLLKKENKVTTLPALRRFVVRTFGDEHYITYVSRNGWKKAKRRVGHTSALNNYKENTIENNKEINVNKNDGVNVKIEGISEVHRILTAPPSKFPPRKK